MSRVRQDLAPNDAEESRPSQPSVAAESQHHGLFPLVAELDRGSDKKGCDDSSAERHRGQESGEEDSPAKRPARRKTCRNCRNGISGVVG